MKVLFQGGSNSRNSGGVYNSARLLGLSLNKFHNTNIQFLMHDDEYSNLDKKNYYPLLLHSYKVIGPVNFAYSTDLYKTLNKIQPDVIHNQTLWLYLSIVTNNFYAKTKTPYIISPRGMLDHWQLNQTYSKDLKKKIALTLYGNKNIRNAHCIHALCESEYNSIRNLGIKNPIAIIPNGVEIEEITEKDKLSAKSQDGRNRLLFLSRIHQKKGLENLISAWAQSNPPSHNWDLIIAGETNDKSYESKLLLKTKELMVQDTVKFVGGQFGQNKKNLFFSADAFILPSFSEGLPMSVLEAWSYGLPTIITPQCNLPDGFQSGASLHIDPNVESITHGIRTLISLSEPERHVMGKNALSLVQSKYSWKEISTSMNELYKWVLGSGSKPIFVKD